MAENKKIVIETEMAIGTEMMWGDSDRIQQIVWNLLTNAIKFSELNGMIRVKVDPVGEAYKKFCSIKVIDQGIGIKPEFLDQLFERFSQADSSSIRVHGGLGLGLAIVCDLVLMQGGSVQAESEGLGKGATFTVLLPLKSFTTDAADERLLVKKKTQQESTPDLSGICVMVVEDDPKTLEVLIETLNLFGARTIPFSSAASALAAFMKFELDFPNVLVSDIAMPGEDGYSFIRKIRALGAKQNGDIPALALTAYSTEDHVRRALAAGFNSHMSKPFDVLRLGHRVAEIVK